MFIGEPCWVFIYLDISDFAVANTKRTSGRIAYIQLILLLKSDLAKSSKVKGEGEKRRGN